MSAENISYDLKRFAGIKRDYTNEEVERLRGSIKIEYSLCKNQSQKLWKLLNSEPYVNTLGSLSGNQAVQHAKAGLKAIYLSGWQVAADANTAGEMYPDQSLYPYDSAPKLVESMNNSLIRADQKWNGIYWELYVAIGLLFFICCFGMSQYSQYLERKLKTDNS